MMLPVAVDEAQAIAKQPTLRALQIGMWWQTEQSGGLDRIFSNLVHTLPDVGVEVAGVVEGPSDVDTMTGGRVHSFAPEAAGWVTRMRGLRRTIATEIEKFDPHVIAVHFAMHAAVAGRRIRERPMVMHFHGPWSAEAEQEGASRYTVTAKKFVEGRVYRQADRTIVLSKAFGRLVAERFGVTEDRLRLIPGHVDIDRFAVAQTMAEARGILGWPQDRPILVSVRRLTQRMGLENLIVAMKRVAAVCPDVLLYVAGSGPNAQSLKRQVIETGLERQVHFLGFVSEKLLPFVFRAAQLNVVPTLALEGFGLVAAEALAAGTPSMVTPIGGLPEVVADLTTDLIFQSSHPNDIADGVIAALVGSIRMPDQESCRAYAAAQFATHLAARRTAEVYRRLVSCEG